MENRRCCRIDGRVLTGLLVILLGAIFLVNNLYPDLEVWGFIGRLWPAALIIIGLFMIFGQFKFRNRIAVHTEQSRVVGDLRMDLNGQEIGNVSASQVIGDLTIDLTGSRLKPGINQLSASTVVGDAIMIVPHSMPLKVNARSIVGDLRLDRRKEEGLFPRMEYADDNYESSTDKLLITINGVIGDISLQRV